MTVDGKIRQPTTIYELAHSFVFTFSGILTSEEFELYRTAGPDEIRAAAPEVYEKISQNVVRWTDEWIEYATGSLETVPQQRLDTANRLAGEIDEILRSHFESRNVRYKSLEVVFLPQRIFYDGQRGSGGTMGIFIPFYPDVFFASISPFSPMELVLVHETLHLNKKGERRGRALSEGITETAARHLVVKYELLPQRVLKKYRRVYSDERRRIGVILDRIVERTGSTREDAIDLLLETYLTDDPGDFDGIFGEGTWESLDELSRTTRWHKRGILDVLGADAP